MSASGLPPRQEVLVRGAWVLTVGPAGRIADGAVHLRDGEIVAVGTFDDLHAASPACEVVGDGTGIVIPGFVNTHTHLSETLATGMGSELTLFEWGEQIITPIGRHLTARMATEGTVLKAAEMLLSGVTCVNDMFVHANLGGRVSCGAVDGLDRVGLRGAVSFGAEDAVTGSQEMRAAGVAAVLEEQEQLAAACADSELIEFRYGIGTLLGQSDKLLAAGVERCRAEGWSVHTHLAEVREEVVMASLRWGRRPVAQAAALGLLELPTLFAHVIWVTEAEIAVLADADVAVAHNPIANMILGSGVCPVPRLRSAGIAVGVGTDGAASNDSQNMLEAVKATALLQKVAQIDPAVMSGDDALEMATLGGARALGLDRVIGSLEVGKRADVVLLQDTAELAAIHDPVQQLVYATSPRSVRDVWVDGRRLVDDHTPTTVDEAEQIAVCRPLAAELVAAAGLVERKVSSLCRTS